MSTQPPADQPDDADASDDQGTTVSNWGAEHGQTGWFNQAPEEPDLRDPEEVRPDQDRPQRGL